MAWAALAVVGAILCTIGDHLHATEGVLFYPRPSFWSQSWWVPPLFAGATLAILGGARLFRRLAGAPPIAPPGVRRTVGDLVAFCVAYGATSYFHAAPTALGLVLAGFWVARVLVLEEPGWVVAFSLVTALGGSLFEAGLSSTGAFFYHHPDLLGVPRWLPAIYLFAGLIGVDLERLLAGAAAVRGAAWVPSRTGPTAVAD